MHGDSVALNEANLGILLLVVANYRHTHPEIVSTICEYILAAEDEPDLRGPLLAAAMREALKIEPEPSAPAN